MTPVTFSTQTTHSHVSFCNSCAIDQVGPVAISSAEAPGSLGESGKERGRSARQEGWLILRNQKEAFRDITTR